MRLSKIAMFSEAGQYKGGVSQTNRAWKEHGRLACIRALFVFYLVSRNTNVRKQTFKYIPRDTYFFLIVFNCHCNHH